MYSLHQSKSLKKLNQQTNRITHIFPESNSQFSKNPSVNLSKLGTYKGKFSLTSKYSSLSSQNNNESKYHSEHNQNQVEYMSEANKENIARISNTINVNYPKRNSHQFGLKANFIKTQPDYEEEQESQNMKKILTVASSFNFKNEFQSQNPTNKYPSKENKNTLNNKKSIASKQESIGKGKAKVIENIAAVQRRSKFHKYDNSREENEFLVIEQQTVADIHKKSQVDKKVENRESQAQNKTKKYHPPQILTQTIKLSELNAQKQLEEIKKQLESYQQSMKHITYSMIKMISLIGKIDTDKVQKIDENRNIKIMIQIKSEISTIFNKELGKYIDKLKIREELVEMSKKEQEFIKQQSLSTVSEHESAMTTRQHRKMQSISNQSQKSSNYEDSLSNQEQSYLEESSPDSLLKKYEIKEAFEDEYQQNEHFQDQQEGQSNGSEFFNFDSIKELEIMPSGRNLLQTFNNQHLCNELEAIGKEVKQNLIAQKDEENGKPNKKLNKMNAIISSSALDSEQIQIYEQNLTHALKQISTEQTEILEPFSQPNNICRKLFDQHASSSKETDLSPITRLKNHQSSSHNQVTQEAIKPDHYYEVTSSPQASHEGSNNYLKLMKGDKIKMLRKVDNHRWIAELEDKIGFVEEINVIRRIKFIGVTAQKDLNKSIK